MSSGIRGRCWPAVWIAVLALSVYTCASSRLLAQENAAAEDLMAPPLELPRLVYEGSFVPSVGGLLIESPSGYTPIVTVRSSAGSEVAGSTTPLFGFWVFMPLLPFTPGEHTVEIANEIEPGTPVVSEVTVVAGLTVTPPPVTHGATVRAVQLINDSACCTRIGGFDDTITHCFAEEVTTQARIFPSLRHTGAQTGSQYLVWVRRLLDDPMFAQPMWLPWHGWGALWFTEQAEQYCFEVRALNIVTQEIHVYEELSPTCLAHGDLEPLTTTRPAVEDAALDHSSCPLPPLGYADRWCAINEQPCTEDASAPGCEGYGYQCRGEVLPVAGNGVGGAGGSLAGAGGSAAIAGLAGAGGTSAPATGVGASGIGATDPRPPTDADGAAGMRAALGKPPIENEEGSGFRIGCHVTRVADGTGAKNALTALFVLCTLSVLARVRRRARGLAAHPLAARCAGRRAQAGARGAELASHA